MVIAVAWIPGELIGVRAQAHDVVAGAADGLVIAGVADQDVIAAAAHQRVHPRATDESLGLRPAEQLIVALAAAEFDAQRVAGSLVEQGVIAVATVNDDVQDVGRGRRAAKHRGPIQGDGARSVRAYRQGIGHRATGDRE